MTRHSRWLEIGLALLVFSTAPRVAFAQTTWRATVGAESRDLGRQALAFFPNEIWIHVGDSITWKFNTDEVHTVTFLTDGQMRPPFPVGCPGFSTSPATFDGSTCVTTPPVSGGATFTVNFPAAGNFKLVCLLHENMTGTSTFSTSTRTCRTTRRFYNRQAAQDAREMLADVDAVAITGMVTITIRRATPSRPARRSHGHAGRIADPVGAALRRRQRSMHVGDTVDWGNEDPVTPHTITFGEEPRNPQPPSGNVTSIRTAPGTRPSARRPTTSTPASSSPRLRSGLASAGAARRHAIPRHVHARRCLPVHLRTARRTGMKGKMIVLP